MTAQTKKDLAKKIEESLNIGEILDDILMFVGEEAQPEDVFDKQQLGEWAEENGYVKSEV